jgi:hypothetical protein
MLGLWEMVVAAWQRVRVAGLFDDALRFPVFPHSRRITTTATITTAAAAKGDVTRRERHVLPSHNASAIRHGLSACKRAREHYTIKVQTGHTAESVARTTSTLIANEANRRALGLKNEGIRTNCRKKSSENSELS